MESKFTWATIWPLIKAAMPFLVAILVATGVNISPELQMLLVNNLEALLLAFAAFSTAFPSVKAAVKYKMEAD